MRHPSGGSRSTQSSAGARFRAAVKEESPLQAMGAITAYAGLMARRTGYKALYLSGGGVAANSLGMPDLGISTMEDVLIDARRIVDATGMPLLVDIDTGRSEEHTSELQSLMRISYAVFCLKKK